MNIKNIVFSFLMAGSLFASSITVAVPFKRLACLFVKTVATGSALGLCFAYSVIIDLKKNEMMKAIDLKIDELEAAQKQEIAEQGQKLAAEKIAK